MKKRRNAYGAEKKHLTNCLKAMEERQEYYVPKGAFSRDREISFMDVVSSFFKLDGDSIQSTIYTKLGLTTTASAFGKRRKLVSWRCFQDLFYLHQSGLKRERRYKGYLPVAIDGTEIPLRAEAGDEHYGRSKKGGKRYFIHGNVAFDLMNKAVLDCSLQPAKQKSEEKALLELVPDLKARHTKDKLLVVCDRGYEGMAAFMQITDLGVDYLIRIKDIDSSKHMFKELDLPEGEFDLEFDLLVGSSSAKEIMQNPDYKYFYGLKKLNVMKNEDGNKNMKIRLVRFKTDRGYMLVATSVMSDELSTEDINDLYHMRWDEESAFNDFKHSMEAVEMHSRKENTIYQEIWARLTEYNFISAVRMRLETKEKGAKYQRQIAFKTCVELCRAFLFKKADVSVDQLILKSKESVRPGRKDTRKKE